MNIPWLGVLVLVTAVLVLATRHKFTWARESAWTYVTVVAVAAFLLGWYLDGRFSYTIFFQWGLANTGIVQAGFYTWVIGTITAAVAITASAMKSGKFAS